MRDSEFNREQWLWLENRARKSQAAVSVSTGHQDQSGKQTDEIIRGSEDARFPQHNGPGTENEE